MKLSLLRILAFVSLSITTYGVVADQNNNLSILEQDISNSPNMHVGMMVINPDNGKTVYQYQAEQYFHPASNVKLFTAIAAMLDLGPSYQFSTTLYSSTQKSKDGVLASNVYIKFSGDPSLTSDDLRNLLSNLQQQGIKQIKGNIILDDTIFPADLYPLGHVREDSMWSFGAPATSITLDENSVAVTFKANTSTPEIAKVTPDFVKVSSALVWENDANTKLCSFQAETIDAQNILLTGCLPKRLLPTINLAMPNPDAYAKYLVAHDLKALDIRLNGQIITGVTPKNITTVLAQHSSADLSDLLTWMLQNSDNLYASAITKTMGLKAFNIADDKAGAVAIMNTLAPYQLPNYHLEDGNGGSTYDLVTPVVMAELLYHANKNPELANFLLSALPEVDVDGTLTDFPAATLKGKTLAKTGTMTDTSSLSGFIETKSGNTLIFSLLIDDTPLHNKEFKAFEAKVLLDLYNAE